MCNDNDFVDILKNIYWMVRDCSLFMVMAGKRGYNKYGLGLSETYTIDCVRLG